MHDQVEREKTIKTKKKRKKWWTCSDHLKIIFVSMSRVTKNHWSDLTNLQNCNVMKKFWEEIHVALKVCNFGFNKIRLEPIF